MKHQSWIVDQTKINIEQWDAIMANYYPHTKQWHEDPKLYLEQVVFKCNYLEALKSINFLEYLKPKSVVMDLGCGGGWLTAHLSKIKEVDKIYAIDSSINYLKNILPKVIDNMNGDSKKVKTIQGVFSPILIESNSIDLIVISSAAHHAHNLNELLNELNRILKKNGFLLILNETPTNQFRFILSISKAFTKIMYNNLFKRFLILSPSISSTGYTYDPILGDIDYPKWYWCKAIKSSNFNLLKIINSKMWTVKNRKGRYLKHFICIKY